MPRHLQLLAILVPFMAMQGADQPAYGNEQLPWGTAREPEVVTPQTVPTPSPQPLQPGYGTSRSANQGEPENYVPGDYPSQTAPYQGYESNDPYGAPQQQRNYTPYPAPYADPIEPQTPGTTYDGSAPPQGYQTPEPYQTAPGSYPPVDPNPTAYPPSSDNPVDTFSVDEIQATGHRFFGTITSGLASVIEYAFSQAGRPNGYILGEEAGGAFVAGLRYGEGILHTKNLGEHKVYWQGPSLGYDFGAEGSKTMVLVYNLRSPYDIYTTFGGVGGQAYLVGGVGINFQANGDIKLAPIRSGIGLRLGANIGYLKYTRNPTWNPF